jgi:hypothetical protein
MTLFVNSLIVISPTRMCNVDKFDEIGAKSQQ